MAVQRIKGSAFTTTEHLDKANAVARINHRHAHLGLSAPTPLEMSSSVKDVAPAGGYKRNRRTKEVVPVGPMTTVKPPKNKSVPDGLNAFFVHPETGKMMPEVQDMEGLRNHPGFRLMVQRNIEEYKRVTSNPQRAAAALDFYPNEQRNLADTGRRFNEARARTGEKQYFPDQPELAGALLRGGYSQNNSEQNRLRMVEKSAETGELQPHLSTRPSGKMPGKIPHAIENDIHPLDVYGTKKLYDFTGSMLAPDTWDGTHSGVRRGLGYTVDRHQHDTAVGRDFGNIPLALSGGEQSVEHRRYRVMQAALADANALAAPHLSPAQFQSSTWSGHPQ